MNGAIILGIVCRVRFSEVGLGGTLFIMMSVSRSGGFGVI